VIVNGENNYPHDLMLEICLIHVGAFFELLVSFLQLLSSAGSQCGTFLRFELGVFKRSSYNRLTNR
jgi:hypothetical protein